MLLTGMRLMACSSAFLLDHQPRDCTTYNWLGPLLLIGNQENALRVHLQLDLTEAFSILSIEAPLSLMAQVCIKLI